MRKQLLSSRLLMLPSPRVDDAQKGKVVIQWSQMATLSSNETLLVELEPDQITAYPSSRSALTRHCNMFGFDPASQRMKIADEGNIMMDARE